MTMTDSTKTSHSLIGILEQQFAQSTKPIEWLMIAHNNSRLVKTVSDALPNESAAVLEISQDTWEEKWNQLSEAIEWALQQGELKNLILIGHSQACGATSRAKLVGSCDGAESKTENNYARMVAGVKRTNSQNHDAQARFAKQVQAMTDIPVVHNRWADDSLSVFGLFYRSHDGAYLACDPSNGKFRPLTAC